MSRKTSTTPSRSPRQKYTDEFKREAVQMLLDGHSAVSIAEQLDIPDANMLYRWRATLTREAGTVGEALDARVKALRQKSRFMNLAATLHWATALLWHLRHFESQSRSGIAAKRFQGQFGWLREFATCLPDWMACQAVMGRALTFIGQAGIYRGAAREFARRAKGLAAGGASRELVERTRWFLKSQEKGLRKHERLPLGTEVLESAFASYKQMICQHAKEGISTLDPSANKLPNYVSRPRPNLIVPFTVEGVSLNPDRLHFGFRTPSSASSISFRRRAGKTASPPLAFDSKAVS